ncbi:hypothetical protein ACYPKM_01300 [Pseudomonas aeruginosa]
MTYDLQTLERVVDDAAERSLYFRKEIRSEIREYLAMGLDPAGLFTSALGSGQFGEAFLIFKEYGPFQLSLRYDNEEGYRCRTVGEKEHQCDIWRLGRRVEADFNADYPIILLMEAAGLFSDESRKTTLRALQELGYREMEYTADKLHLGLKPRDIPVLNDTHISNPDLYFAARALRERQAGRLYEHMLCWVAEVDAKAYSDVVRPLRIHQTFSLASRPGVHHPITEAGEWMSHPADTIEAFDFRLSVAGAEPTMDDLRMLLAFCPRQNYYGLGTKPGYVLCGVPFDFLETMSADAPDEAQLSRASKILQSKLVISVAGLVVEKSNLKRLAEENDEMILTAAQGYKLIHQLPELAHLIRKYVPEQRLRLFVVRQHEPNGASKLDALGYHRVRNDLGVSTTALEVVLTDEDIKVLSNSGNQFDIGTVVTLKNYDPNLSREQALSRADEAIALYLDMAQEPGILNGISLSMEPAAILDSMMEMPGLNMKPYNPQQIIGCFMRYRGVEHFADHATSLKRWEALAMAFGTDGLRPVWDRVPKQIKVKEMGRGMSL